MPRRIRPSRRVTSSAQLERALGQVNAAELLRTSLRDAVHRIEVDGGMSREELIQVLGDLVDQWIESACARRSKSRIIRRCGDTLGDIAEWVVEDRLEELLS